MIDSKFLEAMLDGIAYCKLVNDQSGTGAVYQYVRVNRAFEVLVGQGREQLIGGQLTDLTPELVADLGMETSATDTSFQAKTAKREHYFAQVKRWCLIYTFAPKNDELVIVCNDITELRKRYTDLEKQNRVLYKRNKQFQKKMLKPKVTVRSNLTNSGGFLEKTELREEICDLLCQASNDGLWYWNITDGRLLLIGSWYRNLKLVDFTPDTQLRQWLDRVCPDDFPELKRIFTDYLRGNIEQCRCRYRLKVGDEEYQWVEITGKALFDPEGNPYIMAGSHTILDQSQPQQDLLEHLDYFDCLTDLPNRLMFMDCLCNAVKVARRNHSKSVVVFLDLERFKTINESFGYAFGDRLLTMVAKRLNKLTRSYEDVVRWGEEEFAFILQGIHEVNEMLGFCARLKQAFNEPFVVDDHRVKLDIKIGVAIYPEDGLEPEDLLFDTETAFNSIKTFARDNWQFYRPVLQEDFARKTEIRKRLRKALELKRFSLQYQPQIEMKTGKIRAVEALLRWKEPNLGWIGPVEFIPFAEESGLILPLGEWVLREACRQNVLWQKQFGVRLIMAVNVSAVQLRQAHFAVMVRDILVETGMEPSLLELEITESVMIYSFETTVAILEELRRMGVRISLDDFGTGYAWLSYLKRLPLDTLKLDKSIINDIHYDLRGKNITEAIVDLVRKLGLTTVAEGVEHQKQLDCLRGSNCDYVQGYLLGRPLFEAEILAMIQRKYRDQTDKY
jgi:diguanylate cyclase (GGDEF)-like protein